MIKTGHKRSVSGYEAEIKQQFWIEKFPNKSWTESELALFSPPLFLPEIHKVVHVEFVRQSETLKAQFYCNNLRHLRENIHHKQPKPAHAKVPLCATTQRIENTFGLSNIIIAHHLRHSSDLATCEFLQFHKMKIKFKGQCFDALEEIQHASQMHSWNGNGLNNLKISLTLEAGEDNLEGEIFLLTFL